VAPRKLTDKSAEITLQLEYMQQQMQPRFTRKGGNRLRTLKRCKRRQLLYFLYNVRSILCKLKKKAKDVGDREKNATKKIATCSLSLSWWNLDMNSSSRSRLRLRISST
jgi:hypothetical protein